jgi:hypothetical protein
MSNNEWQPIETAPKNGINILVFDPDNNSDVGVVIANYFEDNKCWFITWDDTEIEINPTHWMPLPKPPKL